MKILGLVLALGFCLLTASAFADVTGEIIAKDIDNNGNIRVWTQYKVDGVEEVSQYPKINGKSVYCTRYNKQSFLGMTKTEIAERIEKDIHIHDKTLIQKTFNKNAVKTINQIRIDYNRQANQGFMDLPIFPDLIGQKIVEKEASVVLDTDNDNVLDMEIKVKTDGTKTESPYIITP